MSWQRYRKSIPHASFYPVISNIAVSSISGMNATVTWTTDVASTSQVRYGLTPDRNALTVYDGTLVTSHSVHLTGLTVLSPYYFSVLSFSRDSRSESVLNTFSTLAASPLDVDNLSLWLKSDAQVYQDAALTILAAANNDPVKGWKDQSGNGFHMTQGAGQWTYKTSLLNGLSGINNPSTGNYLTNASLPLVTTFTVLAVVNQTGSAGNNHGGILMDTIGEGVELDGINARLGLEGSSNSFTSGFTFPLNTTSIISAVFAGTGATVYRNNINQSLGSANPGDFSSVGCNIGRNAGFGASAYFLGNLFEILLYSRALTTDELTTLYNYLHTKWNV